ncbi:MAG: hypothetical protein JWQ09_760 [Segetibacter sp.]|nr:hypothetical protein [Segetibacter sp.]
MVNLFQGKTEPRGFQGKFREVNISFTIINRSEIYFSTCFLLLITYIIIMKELPLAF